MSVFTLNPREGGFLWRTPPSLDALFGTGESGDVVYEGGGAVTLTAHLFANNLRIGNVNDASTTVVNPNGYGVWVRDTLTFALGGLARHGNVGVGQAGGAAHSANSFGGGGAAGGAGGIFGAGTAGTAATGSWGGGGGAGGICGPPPGGPAGGAGGTSTEPPAAFVPPFAFPFNAWPGLTHGQKYTGSAHFRHSRGGSGGGGGGGDYNGTGGGDPLSLGGGGGGGGGNIWLFARHVRHSPGTLPAVARGVASFGGGGAPSAAEDGGGGGGGGGGTLFLCHQRDCWAGLKPGDSQVPGGAGGLAVYSGGDGVQGEIGTVYFLEV